MLVLTNKPGDTITIGNVVGLKIISVNGKDVKLGFSAPREIPIVRDNAKNKRPHGRQVEMHL